MKKVVLKSFAKFIGKHLCQSLSFNKVAGLRPAFYEILINTCFTEHPRATDSESQYFSQTFQKIIIQVLLLMSRGAFRTQWDIYNEAFLRN